MIEKITPGDAVWHIDASLSNSNADIWHDEENDVTWSVRGSNDGVIEFEFTDADGNEVNQRFRLVEE